MAVSAGEHSSPDRLTLLARAGDILASSPDRQGALERLAGLVVQGFASACAIDVLREDGSLARVAVAPGPDHPVGPDAPHGAAVVMRTAEPELVAETGDELRALGVASLVCVPLLTGEGAVGAITLCSDSRRFGTTDLDVALEIARRVATTVETARLLGSLERSEARYRLLFEQNPLPMWVYDAETLAFLAVNDAAIRHYGYARAEFLGMAITEIRPREDVDDLLADLEARGGPGSTNPGTWRHQKKDGTLIDVEITAGRVIFEGRPAALVLAHDVSERRRLERRLAEAEKMEAIGRLAGGVAHDFNNLLTVISGYAEILLARGDGNGREELGEIAHAAEQASALTRQLLAFSRRQVLHPRVLDLNEIVAGMEPMVKRIIGDDIDVRVRLATGLPAVEADRAQLERVILNLAANARDAMPRGGRLTVETSSAELDAGPGVLLAVSDTGVGMSEEVRRQAFEPFFTTKAQGAGTGLGLATVFGVVSQSGGSVYVYSEEGLGTTFKIYLPAADAAAEPAAAAPAAPATVNGTETVMVVEDDDGVRELVRLMLESRGYRVLAAGGADEALQLCDGDGVDLLLTDVVMPGTSGRVLAERLAKRCPAMRILFMSGYSDEAVYRHGEISPNAAFIEKPFTDVTLTRKVREVLDA
jgi:two-component system, cell cycle sensor histidine kinase and response regulator CckA